MSSDASWLAHALKLAQRAEQNGEVPVGAVLVENDEIVAEGWNQPISSNDPTAHAEIVALRNGAKYFNNYRLINTTLYVTLEPCAMCVGAIIQARIRRLVFGAYDARAGAVKSVFQLLNEERLNHRVEWSGGLMPEECAAILKAFFQKRR